MLNRAHTLATILTIAVMLVCFDSSAQCGYGGTNYGNVTPAGVGQSYSLLNYVWGGDQYTLNVSNGCTYTISMCGTSWDTYITVFNNANVAIAWNDDSCGLQSEVTFTATYTGTVTIQVNQWPCISNFSNAENFVVTWVACAGMGCTDPAACNYDPTATTDDGSCCSDVCVTITAGGGTFDGEISWELLYNGSVIANGAGTSSSNLCLVDDCYQLNLYDSFGDGWNGATITVADDNGDVYYFGTMGTGSFLSVNFCTDPPPPPCYDPAPTGCPSVDAGADIAVPECSDPCTDLAISCSVFETGNTASYDVCSIDYAPPYPYTAGTGFSIGVDDVWTNVVDLPFNFCFFGNIYSQLVVGSNGLVSFNLAYANQGCPWAFSAPCPNPTLPLNSIFGPYHDIDPQVCGDARFAVLGTAPCRVFVVNYDNICQFSCNTIASTHQIVLYETTNVIEVYVEDKPTCAGWNGGNALIGIQNATGTAGYTPPNRQTGPWSCSNEGWRFTPNGTANYEVNWYDQAGWIGTGETIDVCPDDNSQTYVAEATYTMCDGTEVVVSDDVVVSCQAILMSAEWLNFDAEWVNGKQEALCTWSTATENNSAFFSVERSTDGLLWEQLGTVAAAGNSQSVSSYHFVDEEPLFGGAYYRAVEFDVNGERSESEMKWLSRDGAVDVQIGPNPSSGHFAFNRNMSDFRITIRDARGRLVSWEWADDARSIELSSAATGVYFVEWNSLTSNIQVGHEKLIIQK